MVGDSMQYLDFLRQIMNVKMAEKIKEKKSLLIIVDEARKLVAKSENKYGFSIYGGNPEKIIDFLRSDDFDLLVHLFRSANAIDVLIEILEETGRNYSSLPGVAEAVKEKIKELRGGGD